LPPRPQTRALSIHARYGCGRSGACCTAGWAIAVEPGVEEGVRRAWAAGRLRVGGARSADDLLRPAAGLPEGARALLRQGAQGACALFERAGGNLCALHRQLGHGALPLACRQFPRLALLTPDAACLTLSHFCPTAAGLLFDDAPCTVVEDPPAFPADGEYVGLDARQAVPPLLRPDVILGWDGHREWEAHAVAVLTRDTTAPEDALAQLEAQAEAARAWRLEDGPFLAFLASVLSRARFPAPQVAARAFDDDLGLWRTVRACVPEGLAAPDEPAPGAAEADRRFVSPAWRTWAGPIRRYLAARAFASWTALQGRGLRTTVAAVRCALAVLRVEATRAVQSADRGLDASLLKEAIRAADLLLGHLAAPEVLARRLSQAEQ
jgi:hypothetical protein